MVSTPEQLLALEARVMAATAGPYLSAVEELRVLLRDEPEKVRARLLKLVGPKIGPAALSLLATAADMGAMDAAEIIEGETEKPKRKVRPSTRRAISGLAPTSAEALRKAKALIAAGVKPEVALAPVFADSTHIKRTVTSAVNETRNEAVVAVAKAANVPMTLEAERDACVHCLRHQGVITTTGDFPAGLTYGGKPLKTTGRQPCPIHPNCRCRMVPLNSPEYAAALRREADRSILRGYSLPNESPKARLDAVDRLLKSGVAAPKSVKARAEKALKTGKFPDQEKPPSARR